MIQPSAIIWNLVEFVRCEFQSLQGMDVLTV